MSFSPKELIKLLESNGFNYKRSKNVVISYTTIHQPIKLLLFPIMAIKTCQKEPGLQF